jgi:hypothetical protein
MLFCNRKINPKIHMEAQKIANVKSILSKRAMLVVSQYLTSNYTSEP